MCNPSTDQNEALGNSGGKAASANESEFFEVLDYLLMRLQRVQDTFEINTDELNKIMKDNMMDLVALIDSSFDEIENKLGSIESLQYLIKKLKRNQG